jgi:hypothetical protein
LTKERSFAKTTILFASLPIVLEIRKADTWAGLATRRLPVVSLSLPWQNRWHLPIRCRRVSDDEGNRQAPDRATCGRALRPMKITQIVCQILRIGKVVAKTASSQDAVIVRVRSDSGLEGIGEADASPEVVKAIVDAPFSHNIASGLREILVGENPLETERLWQKMYRRTMYFGRTSVGIAAMAAVDMALWDLKGKHYGEPIHRLLGGKQHERIKAYASILFGRDGRDRPTVARGGV